MKKTIALLFLIVCTVSTYCQNFNFNGSISRDVLENYLDKSITMSGLFDADYSGTEREEGIDLIRDTKAKFVGRISGWWGAPSLDAVFNKCQLNVADVKANDNQIICQAAVFEYVTQQVNAYTIPSYVFEAFNLPVENRRFRYSNMLYPAPASQYLVWSQAPMSEGDRLWIPDITQQETQLWFYYLATKYISLGCEAIHFGQAGIMNRRDIGNKLYWSLISKIKKYGSLRNRGVVICDAHAGPGMYYEPDLNITLQQWQTYVPTYNSEKQLLWDFHSQGIFYTKNAPCTNNYQPVTLVLPGPIPNNLLGNSLGGINPLGWHCTNNPSLLEFDNGGVASVVGCSNNDSWNLWGWDNISWFAQQSESYRNDILKYTYYKIKCLDKNAHLIVPGMRIVTPGNGNANWFYRANSIYENQQQTIADIWNGSFAGSTNWVHHNFTDEYVVNQHIPAHASSSMIRVGDNKMFYIATDGLIHGYIKDVGIQGGAWHTISPSYSAQAYHGQNVNSQTQAKSNLIASPDGKTLLYIGVDGYVHGFSVNNDWDDFTYFDFVKPQMVQQSLLAVSGLVFASNSRVYYIANETPTGNKRVHGFIKQSNNIWVTTSPTYGAQVTAQNQVQPFDDLAYEPTKNRLYFRNSDGYLYYFTIIDDWTYTYNVVPQQLLNNQTLRVAGNIACNNNRIYYIGKELSNGELRIHALIDNNGTWSTVSPSHSASIYNGQSLNSQVQPSISSEIAVSPNGQNISYTGVDNKLYYYSDINSGWNYSYNTFPGISSVATGVINSLQYSSNSELFFLAGYKIPQAVIGDLKIHCYRIEESYCENRAIKLLEPNYKTQSKIGNVKSINGFTSNDETLYTTTENIAIYPNPATDILNIDLSADNPNCRYAVLSVTGIKVREGKIDSNSTPVNLASLTNGIYFVVIFDEQSNIIYNKKILLKR